MEVRQNFDMVLARSGLCDWEKRAPTANQVDLSHVSVKVKSAQSLELAFGDATMMKHRRENGAAETGFCRDWLGSWTYLLHAPDVQLPCSLKHYLFDETFRLR